MFHYDMRKSSKAIYYIIGIFLILMIIGLGSKAYFTNKQKAQEVSPADGEIVYGAGNDTIDNYLSHLTTGDDISINASSIQVFGTTTEISAVNNRKIKDGPNIIIYHTHTCESYKMRGSDDYKETAVARTNDQKYNVVTVGNQLAKNLYEKFNGIKGLL